MFPTIEEARKELELAEKLNPGPWVKHSINVGIAAKNIAEKVPDTLEEKTIKEYLRNCEADDYDKLIQICDALATDYGFVILEKRFVDVTRRYGIMKTYIQGWNTTFHNKEYFEEKMGCSIYDVLPDIGRTTFLCPPPWKPTGK